MLISRSFFCLAYDWEKERDIGFVFLMRFCFSDDMEFLFGFLVWLISLTVRQRQVR